jgi:hypothetical protein
MKQINKEEGIQEQIILEDRLVVRASCQEFVKKFSG